jgi:hypothetical protein
MEIEYVQSLILLIGGPRAPNESMKRYLVRVSLETDVDFYSVRDAYYTGRLSKNAQAKFEKAAKRARQTHDVIVYLQLKLAVWEKHPKDYQPQIDATRAYLGQLRQAGEAPSPVASSAGSGDDGTAEAAAGRLAAASAC